MSLLTPDRLFGILKLLLASAFSLIEVSTGLIDNISTRDLVDAERQREIDTQLQIIEELGE